MKKIYRILFLLVALIGYSSCNYLDIVPDETTTDEDTYADKDAVRDYLYSCYVCAKRTIWRQGARPHERVRYIRVPLLKGNTILYYQFFGGCS